jgi:hypothetical protein
MKCFLFILLCITLGGISSSYAQPPTMGEGIVFEYDNVGNRIVRKFELMTIIARKQGIEEPVDTLIESFNNDKKNIIVRSYPNPVADNLIVENLSWNDNDHATVRLYDIAGKLIYTKNITQSKDNIPFTVIAYGTYHVHYYLNGKLLTTWKIIKH